MSYFKNYSILLLALTLSIISCKKDKSEEIVKLKAIEVTAILNQSFVGKDSLSEFAAQFKTIVLTDAEVEKGITIFAASNKAYTLKTNAIKGNAIAADTYLPDSTIIKDYIVSGNLNISTLADGTIMTALSGKKLTFAKKNGASYINDILLYTTNLSAKTGVNVYTLSQVYRAGILPQITSLSDQKTLPGWLLTINGKNFSTTAVNNVVKIDGITAIVHKATANELTVTVPKGITAGLVSVITQGRTLIASVKLTKMNVEVSSIPGTMGETAQGIAVDSDDNLYWTDNFYDVAKNGFSSRIAKYASGQISYYSPTMSGLPITGLKYTAWTIAVDKQKNIYFSNLGAVGGNIGLFKFNTTQPTNAEWWAKSEVPNTLATVFDKDDNLIVWTNNTLKKISPSKVVTTMLGISAFKAVDPSITAVSSYGLAQEAATCYISDANNRRIWAYGVNGLKILAGNAAGAKIAKDGTGTEAQFGLPFGITSDKKGNLYVCDNDYTNNSFLIRMINPYGVVTTIAGNGNGKIDGIGLTAKFQGVNGIAIDSKGDLYIASDEGMIRKITIK